ncbi:thioesterase family protein [Shewanella sp. TC10]|uniref:thioesterase family protein n=1 Tax=Shewanella sp. TC10 TaxID=1419739 RepID=UPI00129D3F14|nr:thioesterase family protein [Shewanella sp. TC10]
MTTDVQTEILKQVAEIFDKNIPFHNLLGLNIQHYDKNGVEVVIRLKPELIGNIYQNILHGGVSATLLDVVGGLTAFAGLVSSRDDWTYEQLEKRLTTLGTIDMRVDFLRPGRGEVFTGTGRVIRSGNRVSVCSMEMHNEDGMQIALGTGTYLVG